MTEISGTLERLIAEEISEGSLHHEGLVDVHQGHDWQVLFRAFLQGIYWKVSGRRMR